MTRRATIEELARWLRARDGFAVIGHVSPDGDAAGSCVAVAAALRAMASARLPACPVGCRRCFRALRARTG